MKTEGLPADCKGIEDSEKELQDFYCKLLYIRHYPMEHKYVSVLKIRPDEDKKTSRLRDKILSLARARAAQGGAEAFEKVLSAEQDRDVCSLSFSVCVFHFPILIPSPPPP